MHVLRFHVNFKSEVSQKYACFRAIFSYFITPLPHFIIMLKGLFQLRLLGINY